MDPTVAAIAKLAERRSKSRHDFDLLRDFDSVMRAQRLSCLPLSACERGRDWLVRQRTAWLFSAHAVLSHSVIELGWAVAYLIYAQFYARRAVCVYEPPCLGRCDAWAPIDEGVLLVEAIFLWST